MPYVLEYTSRHYQRRTARRRAVAAFCAGFAAAAAGFVAFVASSVGNPTFSEIVNSGYTVKKTGAKVEAYQSTADKAFRLKAKWDAAAARQAEFMPYLRLVWSEVPVTNLVAAVAEALETRAIPPLEPRGFSVRMADVPADWTGADASPIRKLVASIRWTTVTGHDEDTAAEARAAISNLFATVSVPGVATNSAVRRVSFPAGNREGLEVVAEWDFPTVRRMPVSKNLGEVVEKLRAFHGEALDVALFPSANAGVKATLKAAFTDLDDRRARPSPFAHSMDPGRWMASAGFKGWSLPAHEGARKAVEEWNLRVSGRYPWQRGLQRKLMSSPNFLPPAEFSTFVAGFPTPNRLDAVCRAFEDRAAGLSNALDNALFSDFDVNEWDPAEIHPTENLLSSAWGSVAVPTNRLLRVARNGEALVVRHPRRKASGGIRLPDPVHPGVTNRFAFAEWRYAFASTNAPAAPSDLAAGLAAFAGSGQGYEPVSVKASFGPGGGLLDVSVDGLVPVRLMNGD